MAQKINRKCKDCKHCSPPSIIETKNTNPFDLGTPKRKIVYRCMLGMNHTSIKGQVMLIYDESDFKCSNFSRK